MPGELTRADEFLIKEYENAAQLTYHIDQLRNSLTTFFLTLSGVAVAGVGFFLKGEVKTDIGIPSANLIALLLFTVGVLGTGVMLVLARLRSVQLEYFRIINNIRKHFLGTDAGLWSVVELSAATLPGPSRNSGTYYWLSLINFVTAGMFAGALYLFLVKVYPVVGQVPAVWICLWFFGTAMWTEDKVYFCLAQPRAPLRDGA